MSRANRLLVSAFSALLLAGSLPAGADTLGARAFDSEDWADGLVDFRSSDGRNTTLVKGDLSDSGLEVTIPKGSFRGLGPFDRLPSGTEEAWYRYHIQLTDFDAQSSGKLPGLSGLYSQTARGCKPSKPGSPGWSARGLFGAAGSNGAPDGQIPIGTYLYHLDQPGICGELLYWEDSSLRPGRWQCIEGYVKLNQPGIRDGVVKGWLDGVERFSRTGLAFRRANEDGVSIREMWLDIYYGGKKPTSNELNLKIDEVAVSTSGRVGCIDQATNVVASIDNSTAAIASFQPETGQWRLNQSNGSSFSSVPVATYKTGDTWSHHLTGDFSGDGSDDIASFHPSDGTLWVTERWATKFETAKWATLDTSQGWGRHLSGDFTGDGLDEIASYDLANGEWWVSRPVSPVDRSQESARLGWAQDFLPPSPSQMSPVSQLIVETEAWANVNDSFDTSKWGSVEPARGWSDQVVGDFDGDGTDDIGSYHPESGSWWVGLSDGESFSHEKWTTYGIKTGWTNQVVGDFNGDGKDDIANYHSERGGWWVGLSNGTRFNTERWTTFGIDSGWTSQVVGDFNGDEKDDIANYHPARGGWWVSLSNGTRFNTGKWTD